MLGRWKGVDTVSTLETFTCAYWNFLRGLTAFEPMPHTYGLDDADAAVIKLQCNIEFRNLRK